MGPCTLLHAARWTTREAERERLPQRHPDARPLADRRRPDRQRRRAARAAARRVPSTPGHRRRPDPGGVRAVGPGLPRPPRRRLRFALWDGARQTLFAARDARRGPAALLQRRRPDGVVVASSVAAVLAGLPRRPAAGRGVPRRLPRRHAAADRSLWSGCATGSPRVTPWCWAKSGATMRRWWRPVARRPWTRRVERDVLSRCARPSTKRFAAACGPADGVSCDVSGGFDSSTVTATAVSSGRRRPCGRPGVPTATPRPTRSATSKPSRITSGSPSTLLEADDLDVVDPWTSPGGTASRCTPPTPPTRTPSTPGPRPRVLGVAHRRGRGRGLVRRGRRCRRPRGLRPAATGPDHGREQRPGAAGRPARWIATSLAREAAVTAAERAGARQRPRPHRSGSAPVSGVWTVPTPG